MGRTPRLRPPRSGGPSMTTACPLPDSPNMVTPSTHLIRAFIDPLHLEATIVRQVPIACLESTIVQMKEVRVHSGCRPSVAAPKTRRRLTLDRQGAAACLKSARARTHNEPQEHKNDRSPEARTGLVTGPSLQLPRQALRQAGGVHTPERSRDQSLLPGRGLRRRDRRGRGGTGDRARLHQQGGVHRRDGPLHAPVAAQRQGADPHPVPGGGNHLQAARTSCWTPRCASTPRNCCSPSAASSVRDCEAPAPRSATSPSSTSPAASPGPCWICASGAGCHDPPGRHADPDHAPGDRPHRRLLPGDGRAGAEKPGGAGLVSVAGKTIVVFGTR